MAFKMSRSPKDEKLFQNILKNPFTTNVVTLGRGSYIGRSDITFFEDKALNILGGRFSSVAGGTIFLIGGNHPMKSVSTSPLDVKGVIKEIFGNIRSDLVPLPDIRHNPHQIIIGNDVLIGRAVTIMGGVKIGNGAVIGANAVVAKDIPPYAVAVGNPARVVKSRFDMPTVMKFLAVKWWNWSLEKIADNLPLMNDVEKFLETHYTPELDEYPEDEYSMELKSFGGKSYHFIPDFQAQNPLWSKVIKNFQQANLPNAVLVIWLEKNTTDEDATALLEAIGDNKNIFTFNHENNFSPTALRYSTHFITTCEMSSLEALDYLWDTDVKIISALDDDIFKH